MSTFIDYLTRTLQHGYTYPYNVTVKNNTDDSLIVVLSNFREGTKSYRVQVEELPVCEYTHSHTRHWCGNPGCRDS